MDAFVTLLVEFAIPTIIVTTIFALFLRPKSELVRICCLVIGLALYLIFYLLKPLLFDGGGSWAFSSFTGLITALAIIGLFIVGFFFPLPREVRTIFKRELKSYFTSPIAYVLFVVFLGISNTFSFFVTGFLESGEADLRLPYFQLLPWCLILIAPAVGMRLWSEEQRLGTMELLLTMPITPWHAILGKYLAAAVVLFAMLVLSFPIVWTINYLGDPDNGVIMAGFVATFFVALCFLAITSVVSALTRSQLVALLVSVAFCLVLLLGGLPQVSNILMNMKGGWLFLWPALKLINILSVMPHFSELAKGVLGTRDIVFFLTFIGFCLFATSFALRIKRA